MEYADDANLLGENINAINKCIGPPLVASEEAGRD
jgi:hypothetical protein